MGQKRTLRILKILLLVATVILIGGSATRILAPIGFVLAICPLLMLSTLLASEREHMLPGIHLEFLIEFHFVLAGMIALMCTMLV
jgi:4-hydroxy-3-methylbut-2-enyl diphosphate reductase